MQAYTNNKLKTAWEITRKIKNWPDAFDLRLRRTRKGLRLLSFRDGLNVICRGDSRDWDVVHELLFAGGYGRAFSYLKNLKGNPVVLDLGGNIGLFSLAAALAHKNAQIYAYEPGPPNYRMFEMNCLLNAEIGERIHLRKEAVAGETRTMQWHFDALNPGGSGLFAGNGNSFPVQVRSFAEVIHSLPGSVGLAKIDIEGAEFELLEKTSPEIWGRVSAVSLELHDDPEGRVKQKDFLDRMVGFGFRMEEESVCSYFFHRP
ncbi:MAG: FkbM family methyltransferase [Verrucomicrobiota bacterium]